MTTIFRQPSTETEYLYRAGVFEDFMIFPSAAPSGATVSAADADEMMWTARGWKITKDAGAVAAIDLNRPDGNLQMTVDATNEEAYFLSREFTLFQNFKTFELSCRVEHGQSDERTDLNFIFGAMNDVGLGALVDDEGGPEAGKDQAVIWKLGGEENFHCGASLAADENPNNVSNNIWGLANQRTTAFQSLKIICESTGKQMKITYHYDPRGFGGFEPLTDTRNKPIVDWFARNGVANLMSVFIGVKNKTSTANTVFADYIVGDVRRNDP